MCQNNPAEICVDYSWMISMQNWIIIFSIVKAHYEPELKFSCIQNQTVIFNSADFYARLCFSCAIF